jgi:hypothetical protein
MAWNYDPSQLATSQKDQVRVEIQDTDSSVALLQDEEIEYALSVESNLWGAAARCCEQLSRRFMQKPDTRLGRNLELRYAQQQKQYADMAKDLRRKAMGAAVPWAGGTSKSEKETAEADSDRVQPIFTKTMQDNERIGGWAPDSVDGTGVIAP